tara:strand:- start:1813 stop:1953 length:141 start_codon:yes stop_codon:yes gene_type:complete
MKTFIKPSGVKVTVNANSYDVAKNFGWVAEDEQKPAPKKEKKAEDK